ncbi:tRNA uridine 5-oxyacetic acid(34) methyltransferase CmoM [Simiduia litorea]|uniref:methyltransferase domain-containing protein n=1 Tax=Simiduia litorea TaxID=1435348 RepID=UPI0036F32692
MHKPPSRKRPPILDSDRNFDDLAPRFARNVYGGAKGALRLAVLQRDFQQHLSELLGQATGVDIFDAGGGQGQFGLTQAVAGHRLTLCDISAEMLALAKAHAEVMGATQVEFIHDSAQRIAQQPVHQRRYDLVLCHAVLEWVVDQEGLLKALSDFLKPGGYLSLTFYNRHGLVMKNLLRGQEPPILTGEFRPHRGSLTPNRPLDPAQVLAWLEADWQLLCHSGIRVFQDYQLTPESRLMSPQTLLELELRLSREEPFRSLGRYQHLLLKKR